MLTSTIFFLIPCLPFLYSVLWNLWCDVFIWTMSSCCPIGGGDNDICIIITYLLCFWWCHLLQQWIRYGLLDSIPFCGTNSPFSIILNDALMLIIVINIVQMVSLMMLMSRDWQSFLLLLLNNWCYLGLLVLLVLQCCCWNWCHWLTSRRHHCKITYFIQTSFNHSYIRPLGKGHLQRIGSSQSVPQDFAKCLNSIECGPWFIVFGARTLWRQQWWTKEVSNSFDQISTFYISFYFNV